MVDIGKSSFPSGCRGQGGRLTLRRVRVRSGNFGGSRCEPRPGVLDKSPADADLSKTLRVLVDEGLGRGQSITCFILT